MPHFAVTAIGTDRPGIVAAMTGALFQVGGNLEDVSSTILRGHFAMMLVVNAPPDVDRLRLQGALGEAAAPLGVAVSVRDVEAGAPTRPQSTHLLVAYGSDRPGIVSGLCGLLAERGVNVTDLSCRLVGEDHPVYAMVAELALPDGLDARELDEDIHRVAEELGVDVTFHPVEVETL